MLPVGFEPTILVLERAKTVHALDRAGTVIGSASSTTAKNCTQVKNMLHANYLQIFLITCSPSYLSVYLTHVSLLCFINLKILAIYLKKLINK
jgi:hypothetical protein